jgi:hypothetical protein
MSDMVCLLSTKEHRRLPAVRKAMQDRKIATPDLDCKCQEGTDGRANPPQD